VIDYAVNAGFCTAIQSASVDQRRRSRMKKMTKFWLIMAINIYLNGVVLSSILKEITL
jgi:hypothetical protein